MNIATAIEQERHSTRIPVSLTIEYEGFDKLPEPERYEALCKALRMVWEKLLIEAFPGGYMPEFDLMIQTSQPKQEFE